jgi:hypothetical protein
MRRFVIAGAVLALLVVVFASRSRGAGARATTIARGLPAGALVYVETPRLGELVAAWRDSGARRRFAGSPADEAMRRSMLFLRLAERVAALEALAGFELDFDRAAAMFGREAGVAVYDLSDTRFVLVTRLTDAQLGKTPLEAARRKLAPRRHAGLDYHVAERGGHVLAFAQVGDRLLVGNDLAHFREALVLTAREAGVRTDGAKVASIADDADYAGLLAGAPADAAARVFVRLARLRGTHHFDSFWFFHWAAERPSPRVDGLRASLLSLRLDADGARETRQHVVDDAGLLSGLPEGADEQACAALPPGLLVSTGEGTPRLARLLPRADARREWSAEEQAALAAAQALDLGARGRWLEVVQLAGGRRSGAIAVKVDERFDQVAFERAIVGVLGAGLGARVPLAFASGAGGTRVLEIPLVSDWRLVLARPAPGVLLVSTGGVEVPAAALGLLEPGAPRCARVDLAAAAAELGGLSRALAGGPLADPAHRLLLDGVAPALLATPGISRATTVTFRKKTVLVEESHIRW